MLYNLSSRHGTKPLNLKDEDTYMDVSLAGPRPYWIPQDLDLNSLPEGLRLAVSEILTPAYVELVLKAPTALERASGMTFAHRGAMRLGREGAGFRGPGGCD